MKNIDKKELHSIFKEIANKNEKEFNKLYERYNKLIYAIAFSILKNKENSEDVVQIVFAKIWNMNVESLPTNSEATWLYSLTKNESLNLLRKQRNTTNIDEVYYIIDNDKKLEDIVEKDAYNKIISRLDEKEQEIVSLKILSKLSFKEISQILDMPIGTVQWKYYKALHTLKTFLSSLSMFILTMLAFIIQKTQNKSNQEYIVEEINQGQQEEQKKKDDETKSEEKDIEPAKSETNDDVIKDTESITDVENRIEIEQETNLTQMDIGLLSISSIFLIITIIFLTFSIKGQQKAKRKVSK